MYLWNNSFINVRIVCSAGGDWSDIISKMAMSGISYMCILFPSFVLQIDYGFIRENKVMYSYYLFGNGSLRGAF